MISVNVIRFASSGDDAEQGRDVVRDRLTLAVVVGGEDELVRPLERPLQVGDVPLRVLRDLVDRLEPVSTSTPSWLLGRSRTCPKEARTA